MALSRRPSQRGGGGSLLFGTASVGSAQGAKKTFVPSTGFSFGGFEEATGTAGSLLQGRSTALQRKDSKRSLSKRASGEDDLGIGSFGAVIAPPPKKASGKEKAAVEALAGLFAPLSEPPVTDALGQGRPLGDDVLPTKAASSTQPPQPHDSFSQPPPRLHSTREPPPGGSAEGPLVDAPAVSEPASGSSADVVVSSGSGREHVIRANDVAGFVEVLKEVAAVPRPRPEPQLPRLLHAFDSMEDDYFGLEEEDELGLEEPVGRARPTQGLLRSRAEAESATAPEEPVSRASPQRPTQRLLRSRAEAESEAHLDDAIHEASAGVAVPLSRASPQRPAQRLWRSRAEAESEAHVDEAMADSGSLCETVVMKRPRSSTNGETDQLPIEESVVEDGIAMPEATAGGPSVKRPKAGCGQANKLAAKKRAAKLVVGEATVNFTCPDGGPSLGVPASAAVRKPRAAPKQRSGRERLMEGGSSKPGAPQKPVPYGANFVRQDMKRNRKGMASKGGSRNSKHVKKWFGKNGKLKPEFTKRSDAQAQWDNANAAFQGSSKNQRWKAAKDQALAERSLVASGQGHLIDSKNFSPAITSDMIKSIGAKVKDDQGLGEIAHSRPADDFLPTSTQSTSTSQADMQTLTSNASSASQTVPEALPEETRSCPCDEPEKPEGPPTAQKDPSDYTGDDLRDVLRSTFNHDDFRPGQQEAVSSVLAYKKTLLLLSTGSGKSLCYQIPAYLLREEGLTLVISPLLSLMQDQLNRLPRCLRGAIVSSQQTREQCRKVMRMVRARYIDVLYISPERLSMWAFDGCGLPPIALACIDEAHCVSEWSHNFRPDYLRLNEFLTGSLGARRLLALTATATRPTIKSVYDILDLDVIVRSDRSFLLQELLDEPAQPRVQRTNLTMDVKRVDGEEAQLKALVELLRSPEYGNRSTIVYVWRKFTADQLSKKLRTYLRLGVHAYHAGLSPETRRATQAAFMDGTARIVVATMAFGMGLDKPDIRVVIHYSIPKSIEHYVQETGRCSRDGEPGHCIALVNKQEFKSMRWLTSGNGGNSGQASIVRRLMALMFGDGMPQEGRRKKVNRFQLSAEAVAEACNGEAITDVPESWQPYYVAFDEAEVAKELNIQQDELHSVLAHFAHRARGHIVLHSKFPTKMKLRFFKTDPAELAQSDPLLRKVLPLAKKVAGVHTLDTAQALASLGGQPSRLSKALWGAQGDEFSVEKADYGYMVAVLCPADEALVETWVADIVAINQNAHRNGLAKLDAAYCALVRATEASDTDANMSNPVSSSSPVSTSQPDAAPTPEGQTKDAVLAHLIDAYFSASSDPSGAVAGDGAAQRRMLREALGDDYSKVQQQQPIPGLEGNQSSGGEARDEKLELESAAVYSVLARLIMDKAWPTLPSEDPSAISHAASQFLAGIGTPMLPAKKWKEHRCWGKFKEFRDFELLEELVGSAYHKLQALRRKKSAPPS